MKFTNFIFHLLFVVIISSCSKEKEIILENDAALIFGHFYGECIGESCIETFKLTTSNLYRDIIKEYMGKEYDFIELTNDKFEQVNDLSNYFPNELLNTNDSIFGCPDCVDQGGLLIEYINDGNIRRWTIDRSKNNIPSYLHEFTDKVAEKIDLLTN